MPRDLVQIDNALFVVATPPLEKGGAGSGNFGHSSRQGIRGGSGGGGGFGGGAGGFSLDDDGYPVLPAEDKKLIERATEENAAAFRQPSYA